MADTKKTFDVLREAVASHIRKKEEMKAEVSRIREGVNSLHKDFNQEIFKEDYGIITIPTACVLNLTRVADSKGLAILSTFCVAQRIGGRHYLYFLASHTKRPGDYSSELKIALINLPDENKKLVKDEHSRKWESYDVMPSEIQVESVRSSDEYAEKLMDMIGTMHVHWASRIAR